MGRQLSLAHASNRLVLVAAPVAGAGVLLWRLSTGADEPLWWAVLAGGAVFLAWATAREYDPDHPMTAGLATVVVLPLLILGKPSLSSAGASLVALRIAVRTTGASPTWLDGLVGIPAAAYLGTRPEAWPSLGALVLVLATDPFSEPRGNQRGLLLAGLLAVAGTVGAILGADLLDWTQPTIPEWIVVGAVGVAAFLSVVNLRHPTSLTDIRGLPLSPSRLRFARLVAMLILVAGLTYLGGPIVRTLTPLWAAVLAAPMTTLAKNVLPGQGPSVRN